MNIIQIFLLIFFAVAIVKVAGQFAAKKIPAGIMIFWVVFWAVAGLITIFPNATAYFAGIAGIGRGADLVVYVSLAILFFIVFKIMVKIEQLKKDITLLTRKNALEEKTK